MSELLLRDKEVFPSDEVLATVLGNSYTAFEQLTGQLLSQGIVPEWNYYRDGNAWLCKLLLKKKNLGWLHVYDRYFIVTCHFTEKHLTGIETLRVSDAIKQEFCNAKITGRLMPMSITVRTEEPLQDVLNMLAFKKECK